MFRSTGCDNKLYNLLGVSNTASDSEIKKAYRKKAMKYHPDKSNDSNRKENENKFKLLSHAYDILKDSEKRATYDKYGEEGLKGMSGFDGSDPFDMFSNLFSGGMGGSPFGFSTGRRRTRRGEDRIEEINIDLEDIYNNVVKKIDIKQKVKCEACRGTGAKSDADIVTCSQCNGKGKMMRIINIGPGMIQQSMSTCNKCSGKGKLILNKCSVCNGSKFQVKNKVLNVPIESDFRNGKKIIFSEMAHYDPDCEEQGNLVLIIRLVEHELFKIKSKNNPYDLVIEKNILLSEALCGVEFMVSHLDGRQVVFKGTDIIKPNHEYFIKGEGLRYNNKMAGDLYIDFNIIYPDKLDNERKKYLQKLLPINISENKPSNFCQEIKFIESGDEKINMEEVNLNDSSENEYSNSRSNEGVECVQQ